MTAPRCDGRATLPAAAGRRARLFGRRRSLVGTTRHGEQRERQEDDRLDVHGRSFPRRAREENPRSFRPMAHPGGTTHRQSRPASVSDGAPPKPSAPGRLAAPPWPVLPLVLPAVYTEEPNVVVVVSVIVVVV